MSGSHSFQTAARQDGISAAVPPVRSIQPHGLLIVVRDTGSDAGARGTLRVVQVSKSASRCLQRPLDGLLLCTLADLGGDLDMRLQELLATRALPRGRLQAVRCTLQGGEQLRAFEGRVQRVATDLLVIELEEIDGTGAVFDTRDRHDPRREVLLPMLQAAVQRFTEAPSSGTLGDMVVRSFRQMTGFDRCIVQVHAEGHAQIVAEARDPGMASLLGLRVRIDDATSADGQQLQHPRHLHCPRVQLVADARQRPVDLVPQLQLPLGEEEGRPVFWPTLLRCPSELQLGSLQRLGVTAMLTVAIVRDGRLWGSVVCHHHRPRRLGLGVLTAVELMAEVIATRLSALDRQALRQVAPQVRQLETRLVEATAEAGDWRQALVRHPEALLQALDASGAVLHLHGETLHLGQVPDAPQVAALLRWLDNGPALASGRFHCASLQSAAPSLSALTPRASGVLAVRLSATRPDWLLWLRPEQRLAVTWAGEPGTQMAAGGAAARWAWRPVGLRSELIEASARPWNDMELALASAFGRVVADITTQVNAVRVLIAEHQLAQLRAAFVASDHAVVVVDAKRGFHCSNVAFDRLRGAAALAHAAPLTVLLQHFRDGTLVRDLIDQAQQDGRAACGVLALVRPGQPDLPLAVRAEPVPAMGGGLLGCVLTFQDQSPIRASESARAHLHSALACMARDGGSDADRAIVEAIIGSTRQTADAVAEDPTAPDASDRFRELEASAASALALLARLPPAPER